MGNNQLINVSDTVNVKNFGVELELIGVDRIMLISALGLHGVVCCEQGYNHSTTNVWKLVPDGSIRGIGACELVSPILNGVNGLKTLRTVCKALDFIDAKVNKSCGLHVHHEAQDLSAIQMRNLINFYARCEYAIDEFMPRSRKRWNNSYCTGMSTQFSTISQPVTQDYANRTRYTKLNLQSWFRQKTVEYRQHGGTIDFDKIYHWVIFTANFTKYAKLKRTDNFTIIEKAWIPKHLKLSKNVWKFFKVRMKKLSDIKRVPTGTRLDQVDAYRDYIARREATIAIDDLTCEVRAA